MAGKPAQHREEHVLIVTDGKGRKEILLREEIYSLGREVNAVSCCNHSSSHAIMLL